MENKNLTVEKCEAEATLFDIVTSPEFQIEIDSVIQTFDFLDRSIFLGEEIEQAHANIVFELIKLWNQIDKSEKIPIEERVPIKIYINTPGGDLDATFVIMGAIKTSETPVHTITAGTGYSAGFFIGICGHKRFGYPYSSYLFHEGALEVGGDCHKFMQRADFHKIQLKQLREIVLNNTKINSNQYDTFKNDDWFMTAKEAIENGVIDEIIEKI